MSAVKAESAREFIAAQIRTDSPTYVVKTSPAGAPDNLPSSKVAQVNIFRDKLTNGPTTLKHDLAVEVMTVSSDEDRIDEVLDSVMESLQRLQGVTWTDAERSKFSDKYHGYTINVSLTTSHTYKALVTSEGATP